MNALLLLGGHSDIGGELAARLCSGRPVVLAARRADSLTDVAARLRTAGATTVHTLDFEAADLASHRELVERAQELAGGVSTAVLAFGILGDQARAEMDEAHAAEIATIDYTSQVSMLTVLADTMPHGEIVAFSSTKSIGTSKTFFLYSHALNIFWLT